MEFNYKKFFEMQKHLDDSIYLKHNTSEQDTLNRRLLAFLVEVGELANETRCFKFWSVKSSSSDQVILEEYIDGIHFLFSIGLTLKQEENIQLESLKLEHDATLCSQFLKVYQSIIKLTEELSTDNYLELFNDYLELGVLLGFDGQDLERGYFAKNLINHDRQNKRY